MYVIAHWSSISFPTSVDRITGTFAQLTDATLNSSQSLHFTKS